MKGKILGLALALGALAMPSVAAAHTGFVTCDSTGVVFHYNANFERDTLALETIRQADKVSTKVVGVKRKTASSDTWPGITGTIWAGAKWRGGGIPWTRLVCPTPPPPVAPPVVTPPPVTPPAAPPAPPAAPPVAATPPPVAAPPASPAAAAAPAVVTPPKTAPKCPKGTTRKSYDAKTGVLVCFKILRDTTKPKKGAKPRVSIHRSGGVTG